MQRVRLRRGADLLRSTDLPIKLIATSVGYLSRSYFTRAFSAAHGISPKAFRESAASSERVLQLVSQPSLIEWAVSAVGDLLDDEDT